MPLRKTENGRECPLGFFKIPPYQSNTSSYLIQNCLGCNFADPASEGTDLEKICQCPATMTLPEYHELKEQYESIEDDPTKQGFQEFVRKHYQKK